MLRKILTLCSFALFGTAVAAHAGTITDLGSVYTLTYASAGTNLYDVFLTIDTTGFTGPSSSYLNDVALKIVSQNSDFLTAPTLISGPSGYPTTTQATGINGGGNAGCNGPSNGFFCSQYNGAGRGLLVGSVYNFEWSVSAALSDLLTGTNDASIKALYLSSVGRNNGLTSAAITLDPTPPVPEPSSLVLLASGILGAGGMMRRRIIAACKA